MINFSSFVSLIICLHTIVVRRDSFMNQALIRSLLSSHSMVLLLQWHHAWHCSGPPQLREHSAPELFNCRWEIMAIPEKTTTVQPETARVTTTSSGPSVGEPNHLSTYKSCPLVQSYSVRCSNCSKKTHPRLVFRR